MKKNLKSGIGRRISECREDMDMTMEDLATMIGVSTNTINRWENEGVPPKATDIAKLSKALNTTCDFLITGIPAENKVLVDELGLSGEAIERLKSKQSRALGIEAKAINLLLSRHYRGLLSSLYMYLFPNFQEPYVQTTKGLVQGLPPMAFPPLIPTEGTKVAYSIGDAIDILLDRAEPKEILDRVMLVKLMNEISDAKKKVYEKAVPVNMSFERSKEHE